MIKLLYTILFSFLSLPCFSQDGLLWRIDGNGSNKTSYLYGTIHISDPRVFRFTDSLLNNFARTSVYAGELALEEVNQRELAKYILMPGDTTLKMLITKAEYKKVKRKARSSLGLLAPLVNRIKPIFTLTIISQPKPLKKSKGKEPEVLDAYFQRIAKEQNKEVIGLESVKEQIQSLDFMPLQEQATMLVEGLDGIGEPDSLVEDLIKVYLSENLDALDSMTRVSEIPDPFSESLIINRNKVMAGRIDNLIKSRSVFIGIGAAHLPGEDGVINLLRARGYKVTSVYPALKKQ